MLRVITLLAVVCLIVAQNATETSAPTTTTTTTVAPSTPAPTNITIPPTISEIYTGYELCENDYALDPTEPRSSWTNKTLPIPTLAVGQTIYGSFEAYDKPESIHGNLYARLVIHNLNMGKVLIRWRQVHTTSSVLTKSSFFAMSKAQRQAFYQSWLPGSEPHDTDLSYPQPKTVTSCSGEWECGFVVEGVEGLEATEQSDLMPVFIFSITNTGAAPIFNKPFIQTYVGDKYPSCRVAPVGIVLGSLWTAAIFIIIIIVVVLLSWEKLMLRKQQMYIPSSANKTPTL